jgi:SepF-like predicted cell division protein (DUF552 family)
VDDKRRDKPKDNISVKISAGSSKREVKEEVKVRNNEKHLGNCKDAVVLNGNGVQKIEHERKKNEPTESSKFPVDESSESEVDVKAKESDSDIDVAVIEDDIDLEDLMRQKVRNGRILLFGILVLCPNHLPYDFVLQMWCQSRA